MLTKDTKGQGLIEMLIAIAIILSAVVGGLSLMIASFNAEQESQRRTVAANLAREAIEICKNYRDSAWVNREDFDIWFRNADLDYTAVPIFDEVEMRWTLDFLPDDISEDSTKVYQYGTGPLSSLMNSVDAHDAAEAGFRRMLTLNPICYDVFNDNEYMIGDGSTCDPDELIGVKITAEIRWQDRAAVHTINVEDRLYNWRWR